MAAAAPAAAPWPGLGWRRGIAAPAGVPGRATQRGGGSPGALRAASGSGCARAAGWHAATRAAPRAAAHRRLPMPCPPAGGRSPVPALPCPRTCTGSRRLLRVMPWASRDRHGRPACGSTEARRSQRPPNVGRRRGCTHSPTRAGGSVFGSTVQQQRRACARLARGSWLRARPRRPRCATDCSDSAARPLFQTATRFCIHVPPNQQPALRSCMLRCLHERSTWEQPLLLLTGSSCNKNSHGTRPTRPPVCRRAASQARNEASTARITLLCSCSAAACAWRLRSSP